MPECSACGVDHDADGYYSGGDYYPGFNLEQWDYQPSPIFHGTDPNNTFYGLELEVTTEDYRAAVIARHHLGDLGYLKSDGSVNGFEIVTHPMSMDYANAHFPWAMLGDLRTNGNCSVRARDNGIHVHVSRDGFSSPSHLYRWMKFIYRNQHAVEAIAGRVANSWARFSDEHRDAQIIHVGGKKHRGKPLPSPCGRCAHCQAYRPAECYVILRASDFRGTDATLDSRYAAINTTNRATLEVRVFAASLRKERVQARLQLVASSVEYTRGLTCQEIAKNDGWEWSAFTDYLNASAVDSDRYAAIASYNERTV